MRQISSFSKSDMLCAQHSGKDPHNLGQLSLPPAEERKQQQQQHSISRLCKRKKASKERSRRIAIALQTAAVVNTAELFPTFSAPTAHILSFSLSSSEALHFPPQRANGESQSGKRNDKKS